eukprot:366490-Chlamydomonas_euryale.AAC.25
MRLNACAQVHVSFQARAGPFKHCGLVWGVRHVKFMGCNTCLFAAHVRAHAWTCPSMSTDMCIPVQGLHHMCWMVRVRVAGSGPMTVLPVLSAARQRGSNSWLGAVTTGTPLHADIAG